MREIARRRWVAKNAGVSTVGVLVLVGVMVFVVLMFVRWNEDLRQRAVIRQTVDGYTTLFEGLYAWRLEHPMSWTDDACELRAHIPNLRIDSSACPNHNEAGLNGAGRPYVLEVDATNRMFIKTVVDDLLTARNVRREFPGIARYDCVTTPGECEITVGVPVPGAITVLNSSLHTDGGNRMQRALWFQGTVVAGDPCEGHGLGVTASGEVMSCQADVWTAM